MLQFVCKRMLRRPVIGVAVFLFAVALAVVLCILNNAETQTQAHYETLRQEIKVTCTLTSLTGASSDYLNISNWQIGLFTGEYIDASKSLSHFVTDVQIRGRQELDGELSKYSLTGITSPVIAKQLWPENGCQIQWAEGYSAQFFSGNEMACILPQALAEDYAEGTLPLVLIPNMAGGTVLETTLVIVGTYQGGDGLQIYCPWNTLRALWNAMGQPERAEALQATLLHNDDAQLFRQTSLAYFQIPDPNAVDADSLDLALDIDDSKLQEVDLSLQNSMRINRLCALAVSLFSAIAGFLIGFLIVRSSKKEIILMRTMGTPNRAIFFGFAFEQMLCVASGIALGGSYNGWHPADRLGILAVVYFAGLTAALLIFLHKNLLATVKEE